MCARAFVTIQIHNTPEMRYQCNKSATNSVESHQKHIRRELEYVCKSFDVLTLLGG